MVGFVKAHTPPDSSPESALPRSWFGIVWISAKQDYVSCFFLEKESQLTTFLCVGFVELGCAK
jgi:hypothetical protein